MASVIFTIGLFGMLISMAVIFVLGLILMFSSKSKKELRPLKTAIAVLASVAGVCMILQIITFLMISSMGSSAGIIL